MSVQLNQHPLIKEAVQLYSKEDRIKLAIEECSELITAFQHLDRNKVDEDAVCEEIADVKIMMEQLSNIFGNDKVDNFVNFKLTRMDGIFKEKRDGAVVVRTDK